MKITEENFIDFLKQKNEEALKYFIVNYSSMIRKTVNKILYLYPSDSEECLYDSIFRIWDKIEYFDESKSSFRNWAAAVAKYTALNRLKLITRVEPAADIDETIVSESPEITDNQLFNEYFLELISCLSDEDKVLFTRLFWFGETSDEAADFLGKSKGSIYSRISRGRKKIIKNNPHLFRRSDTYEK